MSRVVATGDPSSSSSASSASSQSIARNNQERVPTTGPCDDHLYHNQKPQRKSIDKQSMEYVVRSGVAGGIAGSTAKTLMAPLDRVKILFQTSNPNFRKYTGSWLGFWRAGRHIYQTNGFFALYQGHSATLLRIFPYASIKFVAYEQFRAILIRSQDQETAHRRLAAGSLSGIMSVFCTYPLDLIRVRLAYDTQKTQLARGRLFRTIKGIYNETALGNRGFANFYRGFVPTLVGMVPYAGVSFWAHDVFHDIFRSELLAQYTVTDVKNRSETSRKPLKFWAELTAGGLSGIAAQTASYPFEVIRRRMQVGGAVGTKLGMIQTARGIIRAQGISGLFVGLTIGYIKVVPMFACSFFVYERTKLLVGI